MKKQNNGSLVIKVLIALGIFALACLALGIVLDFGWIAGVVWILVFRKKLNTNPIKQKNWTIAVSVLSALSFIFMIYSFANHSESSMDNLAVDPTISQNLTAERTIDTPEETLGAVLTDEPVNETVSDNEDDIPDDGSEDILFDFSSTDTPFGEQNIDGLKVKHGDLLSVIFNDGIVVVKTKIESSYSNKATIAQNYFNVADLVKKHGFNTCNELQYWAVADMSNGDEAKCISFTLDKTAIDALYNERIIENQLGDYAMDLWILPSLQDQ